MAAAVAISEGGDTLHSHGSRDPHSPTPCPQLLGRRAPPRQALRGLWRETFCTTAGSVRELRQRGLALQALQFALSISEFQLQGFTNVRCPFGDSESSSCHQAARAARLGMPLLRTLALPGFVSATGLSTSPSGNTESVSLGSSVRKMK